MMSAIAYNLKKLLKWESRKIKAVAMAKMKEVGNIFKNFVLTSFRYPGFHPIV